MKKPISQELAALIKEAIRYREKGARKTVNTFFTSLSDPSKSNEICYSPAKKLQIKYIRKISEMIRENILGFGSHMYRHIYGMKLAEMHVDDWTIARLLGHRSLRNVKYYRKMSNKITGR